MENQKINEIVNSTKHNIINGIKKYLSLQIMNCNRSLNNPRGYSKRGINILKALFEARSDALKDIELKPEDQWDHNTWCQCMNICNIMYQAAKNDKQPGSKTNLKITKAHFNYCCRYYLRTAPKDKRDACLQTIHDLNQWNSKPTAEMDLANKIMRNK